MNKNRSLLGRALDRMLDAVRARWQSAKAYSSGSSTVRLTDAVLGKWLGGNLSATGKAVTEDAALQISAAWACMRLLSETMGSLPWALYRRDDNGNAERADDHWLSDILAAPNGDMTHVEYREQQVLSLCLSGNAYSLIDRFGGRVTALQPVQGCDMQVKRKGYGDGRTTLPIADGAVYFRYLDRGKWEDLPRERVLHIKGFGKDGLTGLSPIGYARESMGSALAAEDFGARFFSQGGMPSGTVTVPNWLTDDQRKIARENLQTLLGGLDQAHKFALLEGGMTPTAWEHMSLEDMQFLVLRKHSVIEICRYYRVPPHKVAELDRSTNNNIEHQSLEFIEALVPYCTRFEAGFSKWLLPPADRARHFLRINVDALLRADSAARAAIYATFLQNGAASRNEVRAKENWNRIEGLDGYTVQSNMVPVDRLDDLVNAQVTKASQPQPRARDDDDKAAPLSVTVTPPAPQPSDGAGVSILLPELLKKDMKYLVDHPGLRELAKRQDALGARMKQHEEAMQRAQEQAASELKEATERALAAQSAALAAEFAAIVAELQEAKRVALLPSEPVFHSDGEIAGARKVDTLRLH